MNLASLLQAGQHVDWELVAVSEHPEPLLEAFADQQPAGRVQLLVDPPESGCGPGRPAAQARNRAIPCCRAPLLAFLQADQRCLPTRLNRPLTFFARHPELSLIWGGWQVGVQQHQPWRRPHGFSPHSRLQDPCLAAGALSVRREALEAMGGFCEQLPAWSGVDLALQIQASGGLIGWLPEPLVRWRAGPLACPWPVPALLSGLEQLIERHSEGLRPALVLELRFAAQAWCAALAWQQKQHQLAETLLQQAALNAPLPLPRARVQLLEQACRSERWCGKPGDPQMLLRSHFWQHCQELWC